MSRLPWAPWHEVVRLWDDLPSCKLSLHLFAADLYEVLMRSGKSPVYEDTSDECAARRLVLLRPRHADRQSEDDAPLYCPQRRVRRISTDAPPTPTVTSFSSVM